MKASRQQSDEPGYRSGPDRKIIGRVRMSFQKAQVTIEAADSQPGVTGGELVSGGGDALRK